MKIQKPIIAAVALLALLLPMVSCHQKPQAEQPKSEGVYRFERLMFDTPAEQLQEEMLKHQADFASDILVCVPQDPSYMAQVVDFTRDATVRTIYDTVMRYFPDLSSLEKELAQAMDRAQKADDEIASRRVITFVSGMFDYDNRVAVDSKSILISIDQYAVPYMQNYNYFGLPMYLVQLCREEYIAVDCMAALAKEYIVLGDGEPTLLDYMVAEGKALYFVDQVLPKKSEALKVRYTDEQLRWMKKNEKSVWAYLVQNKLLFEKDLYQFHNLIDEAPKTNAFGESAPRTANYIGWKIVEAYVQKTHCSMQELFNEPDAHKILRTSGYRP